MVLSLSRQPAYVLDLGLSQELSFGETEMVEQRSAQ